MLREDVLQDFLADPWKCFYAGVAITIILFFAFFGLSGLTDSDVFAMMSRWLHIVGAIIWIGMVWFVNFVMLPANYAMSDEERPVLLKYIAPNVAPWFLHASTVTLVFGLLTATLLVLILVPAVLGIGSDLARGWRLLMGPRGPRKSPAPAA